LVDGELTRVLDALEVLYPRLYESHTPPPLRWAAGGPLRRITAETQEISAVSCNRSPGDPPAFAASANDLGMSHTGRCFWRPFGRMPRLSGPVMFVLPLLQWESS